jgi:hypothetical protein
MSQEPNGKAGEKMPETEVVAKAKRWQSGRNGRDALQFSPV